MAQNAGFRVEDSGVLYKETRALKGKSTDELGGRLSRYVGAIQGWTHGCHLLRTERGHIGLTVADHKAQKGDMICILLGGQMPFIIREIAVGEGHLLIGRCYVQGLMDGQVMEGLDHPGSKLKATEFYLK